MGKMKDLKYSYEERAQEIAEEEYHTELDKLDKEKQEKIYKRAQADVTNDLANEADNLMDRKRDEEYE